MSTVLRASTSSFASSPVLVVAIAAAWLLIVSAQVTGTADLLHHHALIEHGPPIWIGLPVFLGAWLVMIVAMMLPASLPAVAAFVGRATARTGQAPGSARHDRGSARQASDSVTQAGSVRREPRTTILLARFLAPYALVWAAFGLAIFLGDMVVHRLVDTTPWLAARAWLINGSVIGFAGVYQLLPAKRRSLEVCRHPGAADTSRRTRHRGGAGYGPGFDHALACLFSSGPLMLLMFAEGFSSPWPMAGLTGVMLYEATGRRGQLAATVVGGILVGIAFSVVLTGIG